MKNLKFKKKGIKAKKNVSGITLISLVVTIIVLLILAGISISMLAGQNGILKQAINAQKETTIGQEKEQVELAYTTAITNKVGGKVTRKDLQEELEKIVGERKTQTTNEQDQEGNLGLTVRFIETENYYFVEQGKVRTAEKEEFEQEITGVYAILYSDGDLRFNTTGNEDEEKINNGSTVVLTTNDISTTEFESSGDNPWYSNASSITSVTFEEKVAPQYTKLWFYNCSLIETINNIERLNTRNVENMAAMFYGDTNLETLNLSYFNTENVTDMQSMFVNCRSLKNLDLTSLDTSNVTNMFAMFGNCQSLTSLDVTSFDTSKVTTMQSMFAYCQSLTSLDVTSFDTSNVTTMQSMFAYCQSLTSLDVTSFDTSNVTTMNSMFQVCPSLTSLDVTRFDTRKVTDMKWMFSLCKSLTSLDVSNFDTSQVTNMNQMFNYCENLTSLDISNFDTSSVTDMTYMFRYASKLQVIYVGDKWTTENATVTNMFTGCGVSSVTTKQSD